MYTQFTAIALISFLLDATALADITLDPTTSDLVLGPGPVKYWFASSHLDKTCGGEAFQNFTGSADSCEAIEYDDPSEKGFLVDIQSVLVGSTVGGYEFDFFSGTKTCSASETDQSSTIFTVVDGGTKCVDTSSLNVPESFYVKSVSSNPVITIKELKRRSKTKRTPNAAAYGLVPILTTWDLTFYSGESCSGDKLTTFKGSGSADCKLVYPDLFPVSETIGSVLLDQEFGEYTFSFFTNNECSTDNQAYVKYFDETSGQYCLALPNFDPTSFAVDFTEGVVRSRSPEPLALPDPSTQDHSLATREEVDVAYGALSFKSIDCTGDPTVLDVPSVYTCLDVDVTEVLSVQVWSKDATYGFTIYEDVEVDVCEIKAISEPPTKVVGAGEAECVLVSVEAGVLSYYVSPV